MRYIPASRHDSLLLSAVRQAGATSSAPNVARKVHAAVAGHLQALESDPTKQFELVDEEMAQYFKRWAEALEAGDEAAARAWEAKIDALAADHPFPYAETKQIFYDHFSKSSYESALKNYRAWDGSDPGFGVVEARLPNDARVAVFGDWGTGTEDAKLLFQCLMGHRPDVVLHLGDIYESGVPYECEQFFLRPIDEVCQQLGVARPRIFTIPGNHEWFSGGVGFFELIDVLNESDERWRQEASFFCLRSADDRWQFLGADTGITCINDPTEPGLEASELAWHQDKLRSFTGRTVFMTHHQFVAADLTLNPAAEGDYQFFNHRLVECFQGTPAGGAGTYLDRIDQWLWGHDHYFIPYVDDLAIPAPGTSGLKLRRGQLLGGSARETAERKRDILFTASVQQRGGEPIKPAITNDDLFNHTYGIIDLAAATATYSQVPAWDESDTDPDKTVPAAPLHVEKL